MGQPDSRKDIEKAIGELEVRRKIIENFRDEQDGIAHDNVIEVLNTEIEDLDTAKNSLQFVLDSYYKADCMFCKKTCNTEYPNARIICNDCDNKAHERIEELRDDARGR